MAELINKFKITWDIIKDWIDDNIIWYIWDTPVSVYKSVRHWFWICGTNKIYWKNLKRYVFDSYPWDAYYFYESQYMWLTYAINYFENQCWLLTQESIDFKLKTMKLAKRMLEIYMEKDKLFRMEEDPNIPETEPYYKRLKHICIPYVNLKNKHRFKYLCNDYEGKPGSIQFRTDMYDICPEELYKAKALRLYTQIIERYSGSWWD